MNNFLRLIILIVFAVASASILTGCGKAEYDRRLDASISKYGAMKQPSYDDDYDDEYEDYGSGDSQDSDDEDEDTDEGDEDTDEEDSGDDEESTDDEDADDGGNPFDNEEE